MRAILYGIPFSALLSQVRTTENHLFAQKVLFFCSKKMYNVVGMCSFLLFVGDFRDLLAKFAIAIYPREGTKTVVLSLTWQAELYCNLSPRGDENLGAIIADFFCSIAIYPREGTKTYRVHGFL